MTEERIIELETRMSFLEQGVNELSDVVARQAQQLERLEQIQDKLAERVRELAETGKTKPAPEEKPPHY